MNDSQISGKLLNRLAGVLHELRPDWTEPGILDALSNAAKTAWCSSAGSLVIAATKAATDGKNRTPAVIALDGRHWHEAEAKPGSTAYYGPSMCRCCGEHGHRSEACPNQARREAREAAKAAAIKAMRDGLHTAVERYVPAAEEAA